MTTKLYGTLLVAGSLLCGRTVADPPVPEHRPIVTAILEDGSTVEGLLMEFSRGEYKIRSGGVERAVAETEIRRLAFRPQREPAEPEEAARKVTLPKTPSNSEIDKCIQAMMRARYGQHEPSIARLAPMGPKAIDPLLAAVAKNSGIYQAVAEVLRACPSSWR